MADIERAKYKLEITHQERGYSRTLEVGSIEDLLTDDMIVNWLKEVRDATN